MLRIYFNKIVELHSNPEGLCMGIKGLIWSFYFFQAWSHGDAKIYSKRST